ncbi:hypothetical protein [Streptomyces katrae]|uniref:Uncharacterized protein n=1 Tax=Streptomyces katrae TaxID=68223 RepID=A0A0F4IVU7_9ACTN|nr:hypothetical protein [Streptomyces katrae]KJY25578.1 hypothetical protein VR44_32115 [Streptomyces katrae]
MSSSPTRRPGPPNQTPGAGTSLLGINLSGLIPIYNNINTNLNSPGAINTNTQTFGVTTP